MKSSKMEAGTNGTQNNSQQDTSSVPISKEKYQCGICGKGGFSSFQLLVHRRHHDAFQEYKCEICAMMFISAESLKSHKVTHQKIEALSHSEQMCEKNRPTFLPTDSSHIQHLKNQKVSQDLSSMCEEETSFYETCNTVLLCNSEVDAHEKIHNEASLCQSFEKTSQENCSLYKQDKNIGNLLFKCPDCKLSFPSSRTLARHQQCHSGNSNNCDICYQIVNDKSSLLDHKARVHTGPDLIHCQECGIPFSSKMYLAVHLRNAHGCPEKYQPTQHQCSFCNRYCKTASSLIAHMKTHNSTEHVCEICHRGFISANNLQQHSKVHLSSSGEVTTENYRKCKYCGKEFDGRRQCAKHMITHTKEKPHVCEVCGKSYGLKASLAKHMVSNHMTEEDITAVLNCDICGLRCFSAESLDVHIKTHTDTEEYICGECGDAFLKSRDLKEHKKLMHGEHEQHELPIKYPVRDGNSEAESLAPGISSAGSRVGGVKRSTCQKTHDYDDNIPVTKFPRYNTTNLSSISHNAGQKNQQLYSEEMNCNNEDSFVGNKYSTDMKQNAKFGHSQSISMISDESLPKSSVSDSSSSCFDARSTVGHDLEFHKSHREDCSVSDSLSDNSVMMTDYCMDRSSALVEGKTEKIVKSAFPCLKCDASLATSLDLKRHVSKVHDTRTVKELPRCSLCGVCFRDEEYLQAHIKIHTAFVPIKQEKSDHFGSIDKLSENAYKCSVCDQMFDRSSLLENHVKVHLDDNMCKMWRFHLVDVPKLQSYVCVHISNTSKSCEMPYDSL